MSFDAQYERYQPSNQFGGFREWNGLADDFSNDRHNQCHWSHHEESVEMDSHYYLPQGNLSLQRSFLSHDCHELIEDEQHQFMDPADHDFGKDRSFQDTNNSGYHYGVDDAYDVEDFSISEGELIISEHDTDVEPCFPETPRPKYPASSLRPGASPFSPRELSDLQSPSTWDNLQLSTTPEVPVYGLWTASEVDSGAIRGSAHESVPVLMTNNSPAPPPSLPLFGCC